MLTVTPSTPADIEATGGKPFEFRVRALTIKKDDRVIGVVGVGTLESGITVAFGRLTDEVRKLPVLLHKTALRMLEAAHKRGVKTIVATADPTQPAAERWLERLGFEPEMRHGTKVFVRRAHDVQSLQSDS